MSKTIFNWIVYHSDYPPAHVTGPDKLSAVAAAAKIWRVPWTSIARGCAFKRGKALEERGQ